MLNKLTKITAVAALTFTSCFGTATTLFAKENNHGTVNVNVTNDMVTIGNSAIEREFSIKGNKLVTTKIDNKMGGTIFTPTSGSEEFIINLLKDTSKIKFNKPTEPLTSVKPQQSKVTVSASSTVNEAGVNVDNVIDGEVSTYWASNENTNGVSNEWYEINLGSEKEIKTIKYTPRFDNVAKNNCVGLIKNIEIIFDDNEESKVTQTLTYGDTQEAKVITLESAVRASKVKIKATETHHWNSENVNKAMNIAELDILDEAGNSQVHAESKVAWEISGTSVQNGDGAGYNALIDGDLNSYYHSRYNDNGEGTTSKMPVKLTLDRGNNTPFQTFGYRPRPNNGKNANGNIVKYEIYVSNSETDLFNAENKQLTGKFLYENGVFEGTNTNFFYQEFAEKQTGRYVGINVLEGNGGNFAAGSEIDLYEEAFSTFDQEALYADTAIRTSDLTLKGTPSVEPTTTTINGIEKHGQMITFTFETFKGFDIVEKVVMYDGDHFMRKFMEIKAQDDTQRIDYIDGEHLVVSEDDATWTIPHAGGVVQMEEFKANLGQPIYIDGLFLGSEFPATQTEVIDNTGLIRYFTGKNFTDFARDNQLTKDGKYVTWQTVVGASPAKNMEGTNLDIVKQSFFNYINSIATPSDFRIQYNSWFDNMMRITDENILSSFSAVDKHLSATGVRPLDSYVVDDGWNIYRGNANDLQSGIDIERNGKDDVNKDGFWTFNSKFPQGLTPSSQLVQNFGSNFGVWIGPRGGYNYEGHIANIIEKAGNGSKAGGSIDVADQRYVDNFQAMAIDWMRKYNVNYWKWDGFADNGQYGAFPSGEGVVGYDEKHHHMYGGIHSMYHVTDLWEKWIHLMDDVRKEANTLGIKNLWISLTCYVNPSPWYLQWANSVWIQCVADRGERHNANGDLNNKMDNMLTYRDGAYYDFVVNHKFQFPLANLYNHDPIYGTEGTGIDANSMNGEQFRNYMFMQGTRGTAFWELYYSDSILDEEKYLINADFLEWAEANFDLLRNAIMIGGTPSSTATLTGGTSGDAGKQEAYGFAGFNNTASEGTISMRNPAATEKTIEFTLDDGIGVKTKAGTTYYVSEDHAFAPKNSKAVIPSTVKQGETVSITLQPGETYVLHFNTEKDTTAPTVNKLYIKDANTVQVQATKHVSGADFSVFVDGKKVEASIAKTFEDLRTFDLTLEKPLQNGQKVEVKANAGKDTANNTLAGSVALAYYENGVVASSNTVKGEKVLSDAKNSIEGKNGFSVSMEVKTNQKDVVLLSQGDDYKLGIDQDGRAYFELNGTRTTSKNVIATNENYILTGVKENNGIIKLYVDGKVDSSSYAEVNKEFNVTAANIVVNAKNTTVKNVNVYNESLGYDEVPTLSLNDVVNKIEAEKDHFTQASWQAANMDALLANAKEVLKDGDKAAMQQAQDDLYAGYKQLVPAEMNLALNKDIHAEWISADEKSPITNSGSPLKNANDGKANDSSKYAIVGKDGVATPSFIEIDLGAEYAINNVVLYRYWLDQRTYDATAFVVSNDKDFENKEVLYYSGDSDKFNLGVNPSDALYQESAEGRVLYKGNDVKARYVRLYVSGRKASSPTENHIVELQVFGKQQDPYNVKELETMISEAKELVKDANYTDASKEALNEAIVKAEAVVAEVKANTQEDKTIGYVLDAKDALRKAMDEVVLKMADYSKVDEAIAKAEALNKEDYKDFSAVEAALAAVERDLDITKQEEVDAMATAILAAIDGLEKVEVTPDPEEKPEPEVKPEEKPEVDPETKPEVKPEGDVEIEKPEVKPESKPEMDKEDGSVQTGDTTNYAFLFGSLLVAGAAMVMLLKKRKA